MRQTIVHASQHHDRARPSVFFDDLEACCNRGVGSGPHGEQIAAMLPDIEEGSVGSMDTRLPLPRYWARQRKANGVPRAGLED